MEPLDFADEPDSYESLVIRACSMLSATDARFHLGGFGSDDWHMDIGYDFSIFIEQLPDLMEALVSHSEFELSLYSQGIERALTFSQHADLVRIRCISGTSWQPNPEVETMTPSDLNAMLFKLGRDFIAALETVDSARAIAETLRPSLERKE